MTPELKDAFQKLPVEMQSDCLHLRDLILEVATTHKDIGTLTEILKWGEPSYLTEKPKTGTTLRIGRDKKSNRPALFVNCQTSLIEEFRQIYPEDFVYTGTRAVALRGSAKDASIELKHIIALALTYHSRKRRRSS